MAILPGHTLARRLPAADSLCDVIQLRLKGSTASHQHVQCVADVGQQERKTVHSPF
jgi:hypothetical protein